MTRTDPRCPVALVIPAYNEGDTLRRVAAEACAIHPWVIVVDDGSTDQTSERLADLPVTRLRLPRNMGKAAALWHGMKHALERGATSVVSMDGDGQHRAEDIPRLLAAARAFPDHLVIGSRMHDRKLFPTSRYLANRFANFWLAWAAGYPLCDSQSGFRVYPAKLLEAYAATGLEPRGFVFESEIIIEGGRRGHPPLAVRIPAIYRPGARKSHFRPVADIVRITRMVAGKLLRRALCPLCLWRSLHAPLRFEPAAARPASGDAGEPSTRMAS